MILILTCDGELSSDFVYQILTLKKYPVLRLNSWELLEPGFNVCVTDAGMVLRVNGQEIDINKIGAVWHRKFGFFSQSPFYKSAKNKISPANLNHISKEYSSLLGVLIALFSDRNWLTHPSTLALQKFEILLAAKRAGLTIPDTYILDTRRSLTETSQKHLLISKSVRDVWYINEDLEESGLFNMYTKQLNGDDLVLTPGKFFPSLTQQSIDKEYEIRVFCLLEKTYAMAIFSQNDPLTQVDFRRYNPKNPNRFVPYKLPKTIHNKILKLLKILNLNCCSIDMIKGKDGKYYFLEINVTGQFGMVDFPCNYGLHEALANALIKLDKMYLDEKI